MKNPINQHITTHAGKKMNLSKLVLILAAAFFANPATASASLRVDAKQALAIEAGDYKVVKISKTSKGDNLCGLVGDVHSVSMGTDVTDPTVIIGQARIYGDLNKGLVKDPESYPHGCVYSRSTQAESKRLIDDWFMNCDNENSITHTEIVFSAHKIEFSSEKKISRKGKIIALPVKCTLEKIDASKK